MTAVCKLALSTEMTPSLLREGMARDFIRQVQQLRKDGGLEIENRILVDYFTDDQQVIETLIEWADLIQGETLADQLNALRNVSFHGKCNLVNIGDAKVFIRIKGNSRMHREPVPSRQYRRDNHVANGIGASKAGDGLKDSCHDSLDSMNRVEIDNANSPTAVKTSVTNGTIPSAPQRLLFHHACHSITLSLEVESGRGKVPICQLGCRVCQGLLSWTPTRLRTSRALRGHGSETGALRSIR